VAGWRRIADSANPTQAPGKQKPDETGRLCDFPKRRRFAKSLAEQQLKGGF
jgi:hypothetical protein